MLIIFIINLIIAIIVTYLKLKNIHNQFNLLNFSIVMLSLGFALLIGSITLRKNYEISSIIVFVAAILIILGIIVLIISHLANKTINFDATIRTNVGASLELAAIFIIFLLQYQTFNWIDLIVPEIFMVFGLILIVVQRKK